MFRKEISPKVKQAAEELLVSLDSSREKLTDKQWEVFINYVKTQKMRKRCMPVLLLLTVACAYFTFFGFQKTNKLIARSVPNKVVYVSDGSSKPPISLNPDQIEKYLNRIKALSFDTAALFIATVMMLNVLFLPSVFKRYRLKQIEALVQHKQEPKVTS